MWAISWVYRIDRLKRTYQFGSMLSLVGPSPAEPRLGIIIRLQDHHFRKTYKDAMANGEIRTTDGVSIGDNRPDFVKKDEAETREGYGSRE